MILHGIDVRDTDLKISGFDLAPFLTFRVTFALLRSAGNSPSSKDFEKMRARTGEILSASP